MHKVNNENKTFSSSDSQNQKIKCKQTGTQRSLIVARVDSILEKYHNLRTVMDTLNLPQLSHNYKIVCDLKVINILIGYNLVVVMHLCPYFVS